MTEETNVGTTDVTAEARTLLQQNRPAEAARLLQDDLAGRTGTAAVYIRSAL